LLGNYRVRQPGQRGKKKKEGVSSFPGREKGTGSPPAPKPSELPISHQGGKKKEKGRAGYEPHRQPGEKISAGGISLPSEKKKKKILPEEKNQSKSPPSGKGEKEGRGKKTFPFLSKGKKGILIFIAGPMRRRIRTCRGKRGRA